VYGCNETRKVKIIQQLSTPVITLTQSEINVFPNPVTDQQITISVPETFGNGLARIMDLNGKILSEHRIVSGNNLLNIKLKSVIYLLKISGKNLNYTNKIIVN